MDSECSIIQLTSDEDPDPLGLSNWLDDFGIIAGSLWLVFLLRWGFRKIIFKNPFNFTPRMLIV